MCKHALSAEPRRGLIIVRVTFMLSAVFMVAVMAQMTSAQTRLLRTPTVSATQIAFAYANNIWTVPRAGVGKRTWGGLVHTADTPGFVDGGSMIAPRGGFFTRDNKWAVENEGVGPDIDVENWPKDVIAGRDPQLERAVAEAMRMLKANPSDRATKEPPSPIWGKRP